MSSGAPPPPGNVESTARASVVSEGGNLYVELHDKQGGRVRIPVGEVRATMAQIAAAEIAAEKMGEVYSQLAGKFKDVDVSFDGIMAAVEEFRGGAVHAPRRVDPAAAELPRDLRMLPPVSFRWRRLEGQYTYKAEAMGKKLVVFRPDEPGEPRWLIEIDDERRTIIDGTGGERIWFRTKREAQQVAEFLVRHAA